MVKDKLDLTQDKDYIKHKAIYDDIIKMINESYSGKTYAEVLDYINLQPSFKTVEINCLKEVNQFLFSILNTLLKYGQITGIESSVILDVKSSRKTYVYFPWWAVHTVIDNSIRRIPTK